MWELIRQNRRKSILLFIGMGVALVVLGYVVGAAWLPPDGGMVGVGFALLLWGILSLVAFFQGDNIMLSMAGAKEVTRDVHPQLFNVVEEMRIAANLPGMPKVFIVDEAAPNAFATGRKPDKAAVAVTAGLLSRLNRDELQGVIAHETAHIMNRDTLLMSFAGIMLGAIVLISQVFLRGSLFGVGSSRRYRSSRSSDGGGGQGIVVIVALVFAILTPIMARLLYLAISRKREYLADATAVRLTRYPEGLASALEKISQSTEDMRHANKVTAPMYIANPLKQKGHKLSNLTSTHPPIEERIRILRSIAQGAGFNNYQEAFSKVTGAAALLPASALKDAESVELRKAEAKSTRDHKTQQRDLGDIVRAVNQYAFIACACGLKIKLPPEFKKDKITCPRCSRELMVPTAMLATAGGVLDAVKKTQQQQPDSRDDREQLTYHRHGNGWESFRCTCGHLLQLSPGFTGDHLTCSNCGKNVAIK
ncbi:MAG: M48 family metallopeptidase [bacterium]